MNTRRTAALAGLVLLGALLPLGIATPSTATAGCTSEAVSGTLPPTYCDDSTPPETTLTGMTPTPNDAGWTRTNTASFTFSGAFTDNDTDTIAFECKLDGPSQAADWADCTSPKQYTGLSDTTGTPYTFQVRAYDATDRANDPSLDPLFGVEDTNPKEEDTSPASMTWTQDTQAPDGFLEGPYDPNGRTPVLKQPSTTATIGGSDDITDFRCQLDGVNVACHRGELKLTNLHGGTRSLTLRVTDAAGNTDPNPTTVSFVVPYNLRRGDGWKLVHRQGAFNQDVMRAGAKGASLKFRARNVRAISVVAPSGKGLGAFRVRLDTGPWHVVRPGNKAGADQRTFVIKGPAGMLFSGPLIIESLAKGAMVDALVFPTA